MSEADEAATCDGCGAVATHWCNDCSVLVCSAPDGGCASKHTGHQIGHIAQGDDGEGEDVTHEAIAEEDAYHLLEALEKNAHLVCRKLFRRVPAAISSSTAPLPAAPATISGGASWIVAFDAHSPSAGSQVLSEQAWAFFKEHSFVVIDNVLSREVTAAARHQTMELLQAGKLTDYRNPMDVGRDETARDDKRWFIDPNDLGELATGTLGSLFGRFQSLGAELTAGVSLVDEGATREVQLAYYGSTGQRYVKHRDAIPCDGYSGTQLLRGQAARRVTCTLYFNDEYRNPEVDGGQLRLYVGPEAPAEEPYIDVWPVGGRMVLFLSGAVDHEVRPSLAPRTAIATWYS